MAARGVSLLVLVALAAGCQDPCEAGRICVLIGDGELGFNGDGLPGPQTRLASPTSVGVDPDGRVFVVDYSNMRVRTLEEDGTVSTTVGNGEHAYSEIGRYRLDSALENPVDAAWGPDDRLYVLPQHEGRVITIGPSGLIEACVGTGVLADSGDGGHALDAELGYGGGLALGPDGAIYVSDATFHRVRRIDPSGSIGTVLGTGEAGLGAPGFGPETAIRGPERLALDATGERLIVADTVNHRVLALDLTSLQVEIVAGDGTRGRSGDGGPGVAARLDYPTGVAVAPDGAVLIADLGNDVIRRVGLDGTIAIVAGGEDEKARPHGPAGRFPMRGPAGLAWDGPDLLIAERSGQRVLRWVDASGAR